MCIPAKENMEVEKKVILMLNLFCQIISISYAAPSDFYQILDISEESSEELPTSYTAPSDLTLQEEEADTVNIFTNYISTGYGALKIHETKVSWNDARNICLSEHAQLAVIDSAAKEAILLKHMKENYLTKLWLGVHDLFGDKEWTTIKGKRLNSRHYVHWNDDEPNNEEGDEHCVEMRLGGMNDKPCEVLTGFVCEKNEVS